MENPIFIESGESEASLVPRPPPLNFNPSRRLIMLLRCRPPWCSCQVGSTESQLYSSCQGNLQVYKGII